MLRLALVISASLVLTYLYSQGSSTFTCKDGDALSGSLQAVTP